jgi:hypothetical protein
MDTESTNRQVCWHKFTQYLHQDVFDEPEDFQIAVKSALESMSVNERQVLLSYVDELCLQDTDTQWKRWCGSSSAIRSEKKDIGLFISMLRKFIVR